MTDITTGLLTGNKGDWVRLEPRLFIADRNNVLLSDISHTIDAGTVNANQDGQSAKMTFNAVVSDPNAIGEYQAESGSDSISDFRSYLAPFLKLTYADGSVADDGAGYGVQCGLFATATPRKTIMPTAVVGEYEGRDLTYVLARRAYSTTKRDLAGTNPVAKVKQLLAIEGFTRVNIPDEGRTLASELQWKVGTSILTRCNDLLGAIGYYVLWCDRVGQFMSMPYRSLTAQDADWTYSGGNSSAVFEPFEVAPDISNIVNHLVVVKEDTSNPLKATRKNTNPASPTNSANPPVGIGVVSRVETELAANCQTQADINALADRLIQEWGSVFVNANFRTFPEPWHGLHEIYELDLRDVNAEPIPDAQGRFWCKAWSLGFTADQGEMTHELYRVQPFNSE